MRHSKSFIAEYGPLLPEFAVLFDPTVDEINTLAALRPKMFILSIVTKGDPMNPPDMTKIKPSMYVLRPWLIANFAKQDHMTVARQLIEHFVRTMFSGDE